MHKTYITLYNTVCTRITVNNKQYIIKVYPQKMRPAGRRCCFLAKAQSHVLSGSVSQQQLPTTRPLLPSTHDESLVECLTNTYAPYIRTNTRTPCTHLKQKLLPSPSPCPSLSPPHPSAAAARRLEAADYEPHREVGHHARRLHVHRVGSAAAGGHTGGKAQVSIEVHYRTLQ